MNPLRNIAAVAAVAVALTTGTAFANSNSPTVQTVHHWNAQTSKQAPAQHGVTIGVFGHGRGVGAKPSSHKWR
jgi:hypothetical protein